jgi:enoyl-CoA hydratase/carnithine racemase
MTDILHSVQHGRVLLLTLHRPEKRNALSVELCRKLVESLEEAAGDSRVGAIVLAGKGKSFCAGMDLQELSPANSEEIGRAQEQLFTMGARLGKPIVAAVRGAALGGGAGLVANCHIVITSEDATFGLTEIRLGLWPFVVFRAVAAALGERRTVELALTGRIFDAQEAREMGLTHQIAAEPEKRAMEVAEAIAGFSPTAIHSGLTFVRETRGRDWRTTGEIARLVRNEIFEGGDFQEGLRAFREKRPPRWPSISGGGIEPDEDLP